jgi:hypothetical protein
MTSSTGGSPPDEGPYKLDMAEMLKEVLNRQTDLFAKALNRNEERKGVIKIAPVIKWPVLENDNIDVEEFYEEFGSICGLANDLKGLAPFERLLALKAALKGTRGEVYDSIEKTLHRRWDL